MVIVSTIVVDPVTEEMLEKADAGMELKGPKILVVDDELNCIEREGSMKKIKSHSQEFSKKYCKHMIGNSGFCPGDCMQCIMEFMMFPGVVTM